MIFGGTDHHEQLGALEVGAAEFPERAADGVDHSGRHIDRAETAVRGVIRGAELARKEPGQRLHLVAAGEQREFFGICGAYPGEALLHDRECLVPGNCLELARAALGTLLSSEWPGKTRRRVL